LYNIIIVENDPMVAFINKEYIKKDKRFRVVGEFNDGKKALGFLQKNRVHLVLLELSMPGYDGIMLMRDMLRHGVLADVLVVTASKEGEMLAEALRLGAMDYIIKPYAGDRLKKALDKYVEYNLASQGIATVNQQTVDYFLGTGIRPSGEKTDVKREIMRCFRDEADRKFTTKELAEKLAISTVTVRRHLKGLAGAGVLTYELDYNTGGHPQEVYYIPGYGRKKE